MNFPLLSRFSAVFWKYRFPGFSWNFTLPCTCFLASQEAGNPCAGGHTIDFQVGIRPKFVGWMVWTGWVSEWGFISTIQSTFFPSCRFCPIYIWCYHNGTKMITDNRLNILTCQSLRQRHQATIVCPWRSIYMWYLSQSTIMHNLVRNHTIGSWLGCLCLY